MGKNHSDSASLLLHPYDQEAVVKIPHFRISSVMMLIALIAVDIGSARVVLKAGSQFLFLLSMVGLPMANILAGGLLVAYLRARSRHFLWGFEVSGALALAFFVVMALRSRSLVEIYLIPPIALYEATIGPPPPIGEVSYRLLVGGCFLSLWATWPQLAFALMGGLLARRSGATGGFRGQWPAKRAN